VAVVLDQVVEELRDRLAKALDAGDTERAAALASAARRLAAIDPERRGVGGLRFPLQLALLHPATRRPPAPPAPGRAPPTPPRGPAGGPERRRRRPGPGAAGGPATRPTGGPPAACPTPRGRAGGAPVDADPHGGIPGRRERHRSPPRRLAGGRVDREPEPAGQA